MDTNASVTTLDGADQISLLLHGQRFHVLRLNDFAFEIDSSQLAAQWKDLPSPVKDTGVLVGAGISLPIQFRLRKIENERVYLGFHDISLRDRDQLQKISKGIQGSEKDELHKLSYDELANGGVSKNRPAKAVEKVAGSHTSSLIKKLAAISTMFIAIASIIVWLAFVVNSQASVDVLNGVIIGNYLPINAPVQSVLMEVYAKSGQEVVKGDLLAKMSSTVVATDVALIDAKLRRARSEADAFRTEAERLRATLKFAEQKIQRDMGVVEAEIQRAQSMLKTAQSQLKRIEPLMARGNIAVAEFDTATALLATATAELVRQDAVKESLRVAELAAKSNVLVTAHGVANPMSDLETRIAIAEATIRELEETQAALKMASIPVEIRAPESGVVYAVYRNAGETVKVADQLMAISVDGDNFAMGAIEMKVAPRIRPGQPVSVDIPSLGVSTTGTVVGVGARSLYGLGGFHSELRNSPIEVPIRVALDIDEHRVSSGLRLNMSIRIKEPLKGFKEWIDENIIDHLKSVLDSNSDQVVLKSADANPEMIGQDSFSPVYENSMDIQNREEL